MADSTAVKATHPEASYKETIESILVAFILAFVFRAFVVEAFVIPTGSMAPTLYGAHMRHQCPDCGYTFDVGYRAASNGTNDDLEIPSANKDDRGKDIETDWHCPNCGYKVHGSGDPIRFGDRILVLKYLYLCQKPQRWDVVVFKSPHEDEKSRNEIDPEYALNYIKRLIAIGPESVVILDGDVYIGPPDSTDPASFKIQRKPSYVQDALWRIVYNNDFIPHLGAKARIAYQAHPWIQPWKEEKPSSGWKLSGAPSPLWTDDTATPSRVFEFKDLVGGAAIAFDPDANPDTHGFADWLAYDEPDDRRTLSQFAKVSDLKLSCDYTRRSGDGPLRLQMSKNADVFTAEVTPGKVRLLRANRVLSAVASWIGGPAAADIRILPAQPQIAHEVEVRSKDLPELSGAGPCRIELINVDYRVSVRVNGTEVISTTDEEYHPNVEALWVQEEWAEGTGIPAQTMFAAPMVRIEAQKQDARIDHLTLSRDIYYLSNPTDITKKFWGTIGNVSHLQAGEYFVMGDNSFISADARYWRDPIKLPHEGIPFVESGRVPEQFMLGKAFFVYWPAGYPLPIISRNIVPDFGEMRFIR